MDNLGDKASIAAMSLPRESLETAITTLLKLTDAIVANPEQEKTRRIRLGNETFQERCGQYPKCIEFLIALGFEDKGDFLFMEKADVSRLAEGRKALEHVLRWAGIEVPPPSQATSKPASKFNPYASSMSSTAQTVAVPMGRLAENRAAEAERIKVELAQQKKLLATEGGGTGMIAEPRVFWQASRGTLEDAVLALQQTVNEGDDASVLMDAIACMQASDASKFHSRQKAELAQLKKKKIYNATILRVNFPNKVVLELSFRPKTHWLEVYETVQSCLAEEAKFVQWYLYDTPPIRKFERIQKETLLSSQLVPGAVVHFGVDSRDKDLSKLGHCVSAALFQSLPPEPQPPAPPANTSRGIRGTQS